ncbi:hypothetical protein [Poriferisphaera sp. WC338]|uniref:hypothetical protein n=1 Tax=Poriferisphaera sp. WC338 TaxID=3425129 RepID=UPI003D816979
MLQRGFIDLLFILLCAAIVLLSESIRVGTVEAKPAEVGGGAVSPITVDQVRLVVVQEDKYVFEDKPYETPRQLMQGWQGNECIVLVTGNEQVTHHRMMRVWSDFRDTGVAVKFGAKAINQEESNSQLGGLASREE